MRSPRTPCSVLRTPAAVFTTAALAVVLGLGAGSVSRGATGQPPGGDSLRATLPPDTAVMTPAGLVPAVRCATPSPSAEEAARIERLLRERLRAPTDVGPVVVPIAFHVVRTNAGRWNVGPPALRRQVLVLNRAFRRHGFRFRIEQVRRYRDSRFARGCAETSIEREFKQQHAIDPEATLNVYTCRPGDRTLGWATFPWNTEPGDPRQGVVLLHSTLPGGGAVPYDEGDTLVHEVGHWLGLYHTFHGGCVAPGDRVEDTPAQASPTFGCPASRDSCVRSAGLDPIDNFMDYSDDACMTRFTPGQATRMREVAEAFRGVLVEPSR